MVRRHGGLQTATVCCTSFNYQMSFGTPGADGADARGFAPQALRHTDGACGDRL
jgi:hypothetical protein